MVVKIAGIPLKPHHKDIHLYPYLHTNSLIRAKKRTMAKMYKSNLTAF